MNGLLRLLLVEDSEDDALLIVRHLEDAGCGLQWRRVDTHAALVAVLGEQQWDIVLSDWSIPQFGALEAFSIVKESGLDIPFVIVSGTIGEDTAVEAMRAGVNDFLVKSRLARLIPVIERELRDAETRRRQATMEQQLRHKQVEAQTLVRQSDQARRESEFKSKFLANTSHELRTPLNAIIGFSELLAQEIPDPLTLTQKEYIAHVVEGGHHLLTLINDILDISKIEAGRMDFRRELTPLASVVDAVRGLVQTLADKHGVSLAFTIPADAPDIYVDPVRLKQILYNLLSNAIKFTPAGGSVRLNASNHDGQLSIAVTDSGVGIRAEDMPRLFTEFERIESAAGGYIEGTGLGLALTKRLVALHGGSITAESTPGQGSTFTVALPVRSGLPEQALQ